MFAITLFVINKNSHLKSKFKNHIFTQDLLELFDKSDVNKNHLKDELDLKDVISENRHLSHYYIAFLIFKDNYLFGSGFKTFKIESFKERYFQEKNFHGAGNHPHQLHFEILSELGIVGYMLIISNIFYILFRKFKLNKNFLEKSSILFIVASLIPFLPSGSFFTTFGTTVFFINYSFLLKTNDIT